MLQEFLNDLLEILNVLWVKISGSCHKRQNHKRQRRKRQSVVAKREKSQTRRVLTAILTLPNLT